MVIRVEATKQTSSFCPELATPWRDQPDQTLDLDERRLIRSALRELRRREIQDMEAELARKRSRPPRLLQHEDKENQEG